MSQTTLFAGCLLIAAGILQVAYSSPTPTPTFPTFPPVTTTQHSTTTTRRTTPRPTVTSTTRRTTDTTQQFTTTRTTPRTTVTSTTRGTTTAIPSCTDDYEFCVDSASNGECELYDFMFVSCKKSCNYCGVPRGFYYKTQGDNFFGNDVTNRKECLISNAKKAWFDDDAKITVKGRLKAYMLYVNNIRTLESAYSSTKAKIRLQIWRPSVEAQRKLQLVWEKHITVSLSEEVGFFYKVFVPNPEAIDVLPGDRIGFTNEDNFGAISFEYLGNHKTYYMTIVDNIYPLVNNIYPYQFDQIALPSKFSVGVVVDPAVAWQTGATGPPGPAGPAGSAGGEGERLITYLPTGTPDK